MVAAWGNTSGLVTSSVSDHCHGSGRATDTSQTGVRPPEATEATEATMLDDMYGCPCGIHSWTQQRITPETLEGLFL